MLALATAMREASGFDSIAMPFCMTVEAERYGAVVEMGTRTAQPRVRGVTFEPEGEWELPEPDWREGRAGVLLRALENARAAGVDALRIGNVVGPFTLLGTLTDPLKMLRWTRRRPERLKGCIERLSEDVTRFAVMQAEAGADSVCIAEPTATGEILGGRLFREYVVGPLNRIAEGVRRAGARVIVHVCGDARAIEEGLFEVAADAVSFDSMVDIVGVAKRGAPWRVMGNVSPFVLEAGPAERVRETARRLVEGGVKLVAPGCGIVPETPVAHLRAMSEAVRMRALGGG
jgi:[methyl-Co(III) methanol-specific corrinoid protein]:coenzyme M methyltransferase